MSKITLEDCAQEYDRRAGDSAAGVTVNDYPGAVANHAKAAALIRAAQKVVDAAEQIDGGLITFEGCLLLAVTPELVDDLKEAITAFRKLEEGE